MALLAEAKLHGIAINRKLQARIRHDLIVQPDRAFGNPPWRTLFHSAIPFADAYSAEAPLQDARAPIRH